MGAGQVEIAGHAADHGELLPVLFAEQRHVGQDLVEQLADHGGDAVEMAGARGAAEAVADARDRHVGGEALRIHRLDRRRPEERHAFRFQQRTVAFELARILVEILVGAELERVHEDRDDDVIGPFAGLAHKCQMAFMECAHGRNEGDLS